MDIQIEEENGGTPSPIPESQKCTWDKDYKWNDTKASWKRARAGYKIFCKIQGTIYDGTRESFVELLGNTPLSWEQAFNKETDDGRALLLSIKQLRLGRVSGFLDAHGGHSIGHIMTGKGWDIAHGIGNLVCGLFAIGVVGGVVGGKISNALSSNGDVSIPTPMDEAVPMDVDIYEEVA